MTGATRICCKETPYLSVVSSALSDAHAALALAIPHTSAVSRFHTVGVPVPKRETAGIPSGVAVEALTRPEWPSRTQPAARFDTSAPLSQVAESCLPIRINRRIGVPAFEPTTC